MAKSLNCCQLASFSYSHSRANHELKLRMGFTVRPETRGNERHGLYFIMPLGLADAPENPEPPNRTAADNGYGFP